MNGQRYGEFKLVPVDLIFRRLLYSGDSWSSHQQYSELQTIPRWDRYGYFYKGNILQYTVEPLIKGTSKKQTTSLQRTLPIYRNQYILTPEKRTTSLQRPKWSVPIYSTGIVHWMFLTLCCRIEMGRCSLGRCGLETPHSPTSWIHRPWNIGKNRYWPRLCMQSEKDE